MIALANPASSRSFPVPNEKQREARIARVPAGEQVGQRGDGERRRVRGHVQPVRDQRHRPERHAGSDLNPHHGGGQRDDEPCPALVAGMLATQEHVLVPHVNPRLVRTDIG
jgi:hypothetical protein